VRAIVVIVATACALAGGTEAARAHHRSGPCAVHWRRAWVEEGDVRPIRRLIRCAARRWPVPGGPEAALEVARCESGFRPDAYADGDAGAYAGVYQHRLAYWPARARSLLRPAWFGGRAVPSAYNARANVVVAVRMAHASGWGAWACA